MHDDEDEDVQYVLLPLASKYYVPAPTTVVAHYCGSTTSTPGWLVVYSGGRAPRAHEDQAGAAPPCVVRQPQCQAVVVLVLLLGARASSYDALRALHVVGVVLVAALLQERAVAVVVVVAGCAAAHCGALLLPGGARRPRARRAPPP